MLYSHSILIYIDNLYWNTAESCVIVWCAFETMFILHLEVSWQVMLFPWNCIGVYYVICYRKDEKLEMWFKLSLLLLGLGILRGCLGDCDEEKPRASLVFIIRRMLAALIFLFFRRKNIKYTVLSSVSSHTHIHMVLVAPSYVALNLDFLAAFPNTYKWFINWNKFNPIKLSAPSALFRSVSLALEVVILSVLYLCTSWRTYPGPVITYSAYKRLHCMYSTCSLPLQKKAHIG